MGGYGSGRRASSYPTSDELLFLDIRVLCTQGYFATRAAPGEGLRYSVAWSCRGQPSGDIQLIVPGTDDAYPSGVELVYRVKALYETAWTEVRERIPIATTACHYGGERPWWLCPRCGSRRAVLFSVGGRFRCRACHRVAYSSTRETASDRVFRRALTLQKRLGGHRYGTVFDPEPKPPHMHWATYERICDELHDLSIQSMQDFLARFGKLERDLAGRPASLVDLARAL